MSVKDHRFLKHNTGSIDFIFWGIMQRKIMWSFWGTLYYNFLCLVCDMEKNKNTNCHGCTRTLAGRTSTVEECMNLCKENELCRHYIWHKQRRRWAMDDCRLVVVKKRGDVANVYRNYDTNTITGTCKRGKLTILKMQICTCTFLYYSL